MKINYILWFFREKIRLNTKYPKKKNKKIKNSKKCPDYKVKKYLTNKAKLIYNVYLQGWTIIFFVIYL